MEVEHLTATRDQEAGQIRVTVGIQGGEERAQWVMRQITRHKDVMATFLIDDGNIKTCVEVQVPDAERVAERAGMTVYPASKTPGALSLIGPKHMVDDWVRQHRAEVHHMYHACPASAEGPNRSPSGYQSNSQTNFQGGFSSERKVVLRRRRRSEVVGR